MNWLTLILRNLLRRPLRTALAFVGMTVAIGALAVLSAFGACYQRGLRAELERSGVQLMLVPLGCPYDAAARVFQARTIEVTLPESVLAAARADPAVAVAAPMLLCTIPRADEERTDLWVGIDESSLALKPWWRVETGDAWFAGPDSVILGAEAAVAEARVAGDLLHSPEANRTFRVAGVLARGGTSDDSLFFIPLATAQSAFQQPGRLTAVAIRLYDPAQLSAASKRLQAIPGAQVVTLTEIMGVFLNMIGTVRSLLIGISVVALTVGVLSVLNTMLAAVLERAPELALWRALGASRTQLTLLLAGEAVLLTTGAALAGLVLAWCGGGWLENFARDLVPLAPAGTLAVLTPAQALQFLALGVATGLVAVIYPVMRAIRLAPARAVQPA